MNLMNLMVATMYCLVKSGASGDYFFSASSAYSVVNPRRPFRSSNLVPRLAVVGGVLLAILTDRSSLKQKYFRL